MRINDKYPNRFNFRNLGGYPTTDGKQVKHGYFYRSGTFSFLNEEELEVFKQEGIKYILDLRTEHESVKDPDPELEGVSRFRFSGVVTKGGEEIDFSPAGMNQIGEAGKDQIRKLLSYYTQMPFDNASFKTFFEGVKQEQTPILFHCYTGKDRTGVLAIALLLALGVDEETVFNDYMLSTQYTKEKYEATLLSAKDRLEGHPELLELMTMKDSVSANVGHAVLEEIKKRYGDYDTYIKEEFQFSEEELAEFRAKYTE